MNIKELFKREFLRGFITALPIDSDYTVASLEKVYKKYVKENPKIVKEINSVIKKIK